MYVKKSLLQLEVSSFNFQHQVRLGCGIAIDIWWTCDFLRTFTLDEQAYMVFSNCGEVGGICSRRTVARDGGVRPGWKNDQSRTNSQL